MAFNHSLIVVSQYEILSNEQRSFSTLKWWSLAIALAFGMTTQYMMLRRCPKDPNMSLHRIPPELSLIDCLREASFKSSMNFVRSTKSLFWKPHPVRIANFGLEAYIVQASASIAAMLKESSLSAIPLSAHLMQHAFGLSPNAVHLHYNEAMPGQDDIKPWYIKVKEMNRHFLTGPEGMAFSNRFQAELISHMHALGQSLTTDWTHWDDFMVLFKKDLTAVVLNTSCGQHLLQLSSKFLTDFWEFNDSIIHFLTLHKRLISNRKHEARNDALFAIEKWQRAAAQNFDSVMTDSSGADAWWGSAFFRERYAVMQRLEGYDSKAMASQELAFLYALNSNAIIATFWTTIEIFKDVELLKKVRAEVQSCTIPGKEMKFDTLALLRQPVLQAVFAETLRLRGHGLFVRKARRDVDISGWMISEHSLVVASSTPAHMDPKVWCFPAGEVPGPPVDIFWPGRFLISNGDILEFNPKAAEGSWLPFGGENNPCPGKQFAKLQAILTVTLLVSTIDCEVLADEAKLSMSMKNFGIGILSPVGNIPVRLRSRRAS